MVESSLPPGLSVLDPLLSLLCHLCAFPTDRALPRHQRWLYKDGEKVQATQTSYESQGLNLSVNLRSESGNESTFSCAWATKQSISGEGAVFELSFTVRPLPFPLHHTRAHAHTRAHTNTSPIPGWSQSVIQPRLHGLHLATLLGQGTWHNAKLVQDRVVALGTNTVNPPPTAGLHPAPARSGIVMRLYPEGSSGVRKGLRGSDP